MTVSGGNLPDLDNNLLSLEMSELGAKAAEIQSFNPQYLSPPLPDIFCGAFGAQLGPEIPEEIDMLACLEEPDFLHPCRLHEEGVGQKEAVVVGEVLDMLDKLELCEETLLSFGGLDPPVDHFCVLEADNSCSSASDLSLEHKPALYDQESPLDLSDTICGLHKDTKVWALEETSINFSPHSLLSPSSCEGTLNQSPGLDGVSVMSQSTTRGSSMPVRSLVAWVTSTEEES